MGGGCGGGKTLKARMIAYLAHQYQAQEHALYFADGRVFIGTSLSFAEAAMMCWQGRISLSATGFTHAIFTGMQISAKGLILLFCLWRGGN